MWQLYMPLGGTIDGNNLQKTDNINTARHVYAYGRHRISPSLVQVMACRLFGITGGIVLIGPLGLNYYEIRIKMQCFSVKKIQLKMSSVRCQPF